ncbi:unnamed protein product [Echinostoma caproni]|uniref:Collagen IV NC1 domain-containing protein n=1 Tax=Echinostoma caproni TaxID=27848 RepID=A0A183ATT1_9TREM|nr:unnamed protein product [Echinostoma caproni]
MYQAAGGEGGMPGGFPGGMPGGFPGGMPGAGGAPGGGAGGKGPTIEEQGVGAPDGRGLGAGNAVAIVPSTLVVSF